MPPLYIVMLACPNNAATPHDCVVGLEKSLSGYETQAKCEARAEEIYSKTARELYQAGAVLRIGCVDEQTAKRIQRNLEGNAI